MSQSFYFNLDSATSPTSQDIGRIKIMCIPTKWTVVISRPFSGPALRSTKEIFLYQGNGSHGFVNGAGMRLFSFMFNICLLCWTQVELGMLGCLVGRCGNRFA